MVSVVYLDPAKPEQPIPRVGLMFLDDKKPFGYASSVREALSLFRKKMRSVMTSYSPLAFWGAVGTDGKVYVIGKGGKKNYSSISTLSVNDTSHWPGVFSGNGVKFRWITFAYTGLSTDYDEPYTIGSLLYILPNGVVNRQRAFVISEQWRKKKNDRPLELFERVTTDSYEMVLSVGIYIETFMNFPSRTNMHKNLSARYADLFQSPVVYWQWKGSARFQNLVRVAILNKEPKIDPAKGYLTVQFVVVRDMPSYDPRQAFYDKDGL